MSSESVIKYRPYLSLAEIDAILYCIQFVQENNDPNNDENIEFARLSVLKTKTLAELGLQSAAYKTNPRPTLVDKLGFGTDSISSPLKGVELPDFGDMMNELATIQTSVQPTEKSQ